MTKKYILIIFFILIIILVVSLLYIKGEGNKTKITRYRGDGFSIQLSNNIKVSKLPSKMDFDIYNFKLNNQLILSAYVGNFPSLGIAEEKNVIKVKGIINNLPFESYTIKNPNGTETKEYLFMLRKNDWPIYIHYGYKLSKQKARIAEEIINSTLNQ